MNTARLVLVAALGVWSAVSVAVVLIVGDGIWTGADGGFAGDQLQYLAWIREMGEHGLASEPFDLAADPPVFFHPMFFISGLAWRLGLPLAGSYLLWKPVAVAVVALGVVAYVRRFVGDSVPRVAAVSVLACFFYNPIAVVFEQLDVGPDAIRSGLAFSRGEMFTAGMLWGALPSAISIGLMPFFLLGVQRVFEAERTNASTIAWTSAAGLFSSWLHPWQGATLMVIVALALVWSGRWRRWPRLIMPAAAVAAPVAYYAALGRFVDAWSVAQQATQRPRWPVAVLVLGFVPLVAVAAVGAARRIDDIGERILLLWVPSALFVYFVVPSFPFHAFQGVTIPLAVLGARAWRRLRLAPTLGLVVVALAVIPGVPLAIDALADAVRRGDQTFFLEPDEADALRAVERSSHPGGTLTTPQLGQVAPALTGRGTWVGHPSHTPDYARRAVAADHLFAGGLDAGTARAIVSRSGAGFVVDDCRHDADLETVLGRLIVRAEPFGCATVYHVRGSTTRDTS